MNPFDLKEMLERYNAIQSQPPFVAPLMEQPSEQPVITEEEPIAVEKPKPVVKKAAPPPVQEAPIAQPALDNSAEKAMFQSLLEKSEKEPTLHKDYVNQSAVNTLIGSFGDLANAGARMAGAKDLSPGSDVTASLQSLTDKNFKEQSKMGEMDPNSDISKFYRENAKAYARKMGLDESVVARLDNMSADQLDKLGFKIDGAGGRSDLYFPTLLRNGKRVTIGVDRHTGEEKVNLGEAPFAPRLSTNPYTNEVYNVPVGFDMYNVFGRPGMPQGDPNMRREYVEFLRSKGYDVGPTPNGTQQPHPSQERPKSAQIFNSLNPKQRELLRNNEKEYNGEIEPMRGAFEASERINSALRHGAKEGDLTNAVGVAFARASGDTGALSNVDVGNYKGRADILSKLKTMMSLATNAQFSDEDRAFLQGFAKVYEQDAIKRISNRSKTYVDRVSRDTGVDRGGAADLLNLNAIHPTLRNRTLGIKDWNKIVEKAKKDNPTLPPEKILEALRKKYPDFPKDLK